MDVVKYIVEYMTARGGLANLSEDEKGVLVKMAREDRRKARKAYDTALSEIQHMDALFGP